MIGVLRFWLDRGVDGVRIDASHLLGKDSQLRDNPRRSASARGSSAATNANAAAFVATDQAQGTSPHRLTGE
jgi:glycosidase